MHLYELNHKKIIIKKSYNRFVKHSNFNIRDWILRRALGNKVKATHGKFDTTWEDPYQIYDITPGESYRIESNSIMEKLSWNGKYLKKYYV